ncbi:sulfite exporter TauE/SafE family protein [Embleya sp. NBC_00896]|uniref:sulfite exporter TauE/SafE family protein n=1 Tax=Embleya sp. NBC_00896 TaxID=2975961 RepID=UPI002F90E986|nr:sulfite exporter TauE/SafE family protein [Embleya sp. NBC_00896]
MSVLLLALVTGAVIGLALGALGGGGSVLAVPALIYLLGFTPAAATTASLIIVTATSATALYTHAISGNVRWKTGALFAAAGIVPAIVAATLAARLPQAMLTAAFAAIAALAALKMLKPGDRDPQPRQVRPARAAGAGAGLGAVTGFLGVGGGFLAVPALVSILGLRMRAAVGTSLLVITVNSLAALAARAGTSTPVRWAVIAPFVGTAILGAWDGKRLAAKISGPALQRIFAIVLLVVAALMLADAFH